MNLEKMHYELERKMGNLDLKFDIPSSEISSAFQEAMYIFIDRYYTSFQEDEKARKALNILTAYADYTTFIDPNVVFPNSQKVVLPDDINNRLLYTVLEIGTIGSDTVRIKPIGLDAYRANTKNPFKNPYKQTIWRLELQGAGDSVKTHTLIHGGIPLTKYTLGYIKEPTKYTIEANPTAELQVPEIFQWEIIDIAIDLIAKSNELIKASDQQKQNLT